MLVSADLKEKVGFQKEVDQTIEQLVAARERLEVLIVQAKSQQVNRLLESGCVLSYSRNLTWTASKHRGMSLLAGDSIEEAESIMEEIQEHILIFQNHNQAVYN